MKRSARARAQLGNRNAAKPAEARRVPISARVLPDTRRRLEQLALTHGSLSGAIDAVVRDTQLDTTTPHPEPVSGDRCNLSVDTCNVPARLSEPDRRDGVASQPVANQRPRTGSSIG